VTGIFSGLKFWVEMLRPSCGFGALTRCYRLPVISVVDKRLNDWYCLDIHNKSWVVKISTLDFSGVNFVSFYLDQYNSGLNFKFFDYWISLIYKQTKKQNITFSYDTLLISWCIFCFCDDAVKARNVPLLHLCFKLEMVPLIIM
jgi:hypothetical protein